jgi:hypothetical protein
MVERIISNYICVINLCNQHHYEHDDILAINLQKLTSLNSVSRTTNMTPVKPQISQYQAEKSCQFKFLEMFVYLLTFKSYSSLLIWLKFGIREQKFGDFGGLVCIYNWLAIIIRSKRASASC